MRYEKSCGAVVFTESEGEIKYLLVESKSGHWGFPKGHVEGDETERETALREVREETGVRIDILDGFRAEDEYALPSKRATRKRVVYFLGSFKDQRIVHQKSELSGARLVELSEAMELLRFDGARRIMREADSFLKSSEVTLCLKK